MKSLTLPICILPNKVLWNWRSWYTCILLINCIVMLLACIRCCVHCNILMMQSWWTQCIFYLKFIWIHHVDMELHASNIDHIMFFCMNIFASNIPKVELYNLRWLKLKFHKFSNVIVKIIESLTPKLHLMHQSLFQISQRFGSHTKKDIPMKSDALFESFNTFTKTSKSIWISIIFTLLLWLQLVDQIDVENILFYTIWLSLFEFLYHTKISNYDTHF
jgi:hypothetical protein